jgi:DNA-binding NtrC family response regulator
MRHTVLLVDDEPNVLEGLSRALYTEPYEILCASSVEEAWGLLRAKPVDVVVSDQDMPATPGTVFLSQVRQEFPETVRFMLTGKPSLEVAIQAINEGAISRFFTKPCNDVDLAVTIRQALQQKDLIVAANRLLGRVDRGSAELTWLEHRYPGITQVCRDPDGTIIAEPDDCSIEELLDQLRHATAKAQARLSGSMREVTRHE